MDEKYGIELELITGTFNKQIEKVKNNIQNAFNPEDISGIKINGLSKEITGISNEFKKLTGKKFDLGDAIELKKYNQELQNLGNKAKEIKQEISNIGHASYNSEAIQQYVNKYGQVENKAKIAKQEVEDLNEEVKKSGSISENISNFGKGLDKVISKIKRFTLSLFSIRSAYALVSRASSAYLSQDTELANKLQAVWVGLGSLLEPIISKIANVMLKAVAYINVFVKALTGVDLLAKATAKSMKNATSSAKALSKTLVGFDELTNLDTTSDSSGIDTSWVNAFNDVNLNTEWMEKIQNFAEWLKENGPTIATIIGTIAGAIALIKLGKLLGGLDGISAFFSGGTWKTVLGVTLVLSGIILLVMDLIDYIKSLDSGLENNGTSFKQFGNIITDVGLIITGLGILVLGLPGVIAGVITIIVGLVVSNWDKIKGLLQKAIDWIDSKMDWIGENFGFFGKWIAEIFKGAIQLVLNVFDGLFTGIKQIFDGILLIFKGDFKNGFINIGKGIVNALIGIINGAIAGINAILYPIRSLIVEAGKILGKNWSMSNISIPKIPLLDVGTNYVPEDQLAYIHKGEAVIPKKFNSQEYFGGSDDETKSLLQEIKEAIKEIEINPYTTIQEVGKASIKYINSRSRQLGGSVIN